MLVNTFIILIVLVQTKSILILLQRKGVFKKDRPPLDRLVQDGSRIFKELGTYDCKNPTCTKANFDYM